MGSPSAPAFVLASLLASSCTVRPNGGRTPLPRWDASVEPASEASVRPDSGPNLSNVLVYAHSRNTLYAFDPLSQTVTRVGRFEAEGGELVPSILDLAVDAQGNVYANGERSLYRVDPQTARVSLIGSFGVGAAVFNGLVFVRAGEIDNGEVLLGASDDGTYYRIDETTARAEVLGHYPAGWVSSGDLVSVGSLATFATVRQKQDLGGDTLARIDFRPDGKSQVEMIGPVGHSRVFGLGYWGRLLYGFTADGRLLEINPNTGNGVVSSAVTGASEFWGAGVTTLVPVLD